MNRNPYLELYGTGVVEVATIVGGLSAVRPTGFFSFPLLKVPVVPDR